MMKSLRLLLPSLLFAATWTPSSAQRMEKAEEPDEVGLVTIGKSYFPKPEGAIAIEIPGGNFEGGIPKENDSLATSRYQLVEDAAPEGDRYARAQPGSLSNLIVNLPVAGARAYLLSLWLRSDGEIQGMAACETDAVFYGRHTPLNLPDTGQAWKRVGLYFRTAPGSRSVRILIRRPSDGPELAVDDLRFREASEEEFSRAYTGWRSRYPARDLEPRPGDGGNLALFVSKLINEEKSTEPLRVMGIGSSYTNMLGSGERLVQWIREKFPDAPPIIYRKHVGSAVNYDFTRGWMRQHVLRQQPDLVILYSGGTAADLEKLLKDFRAHSTADVIVASLHLRERDGVISEKTVNPPEWEAIRDVALKYGCEWVDNRREWAAYLEEHGEPIEWLLKDAVHQNDHGALVINENICRHVIGCDDPGYDPETRERWLKFSRDFSNSRGESVTIGSLFLSSGALYAAEKPKSNSGFQLIPDEDLRSKITVKFRGNRLDIHGRTNGENGAVAKLTIDGIPAETYPAFHTTLIRPGADNHKPERGSSADRSPHLVRLGDPKKVVPQIWTIRMTSDSGDYELIGSMTGPDGRGNNGEDFTGDSGQITVPTALWRRRLEKDGIHTNRAGDTWTWEVIRATAPEVSFEGEKGGRFRLTLADQLESGWHQAVLTFEKGGDVGIDGFRVFEPPVKPDSD